jgi:hypothetical protein
MQEGENLTLKRARQVRDGRIVERYPGGREGQPAKGWWTILEPERGS